MRIDYDISDIRPFINWIYFDYAWSMNGKDNEERDRLHADANAMLDRWQGSYHTHAVFRIVDANSDGDDIIADGVRLPMLRQQKPTEPGRPNLCLADFIRPASKGIKDRIGVFAATVDHDMTRGYDNDDYGKMLSQVLADRLAEGTAELTHLQVRQKYWGYAPNENLSIKELHAERYQGIRPAVGYPSMPDTSMNFLIDKLINMGSIGIRLTEPLAYSVQMEMTIVGRNNLLALTSYEWLRKICRNMPTHKLWEDEEFRKKAIELHEKADHEKAIHDYNLLKAKGYEDKFIFLEDVKTLKEFLKEIEFELPKDIRFPQKYEKGIILSGSPYTGINISFGLAHCIASPENPYYVQERAEADSFGIISGNGLPFPYEIVCKLIENNLIPDANIFTSQYVKEEGLKITQANLQFLADYYLMGRKDKDLSPKELW